MFTRLAQFRQYFTAIRFFFTRQLLSKFISLVIVFSLLVNTTPAAPLVIYASSMEFGQDIRYAYLTSPTIAYLAEFSLWDNPVFAFFLKNRKQQRLAKIEVLPTAATLRTGEKIALTAVGYDSEGKQIQGLNFNWKAVDAMEIDGGKAFAEAQAKDPKRRAPNGDDRRAKIPEIILQNGFFEPQFAGVFMVIAESGGVLGTAPVVVNADNQLRAMQEQNEFEKLASDPSAEKRGRKKTFSPASEKFVKAERTAPVRTSSRINPEEKQELEKWDQDQKAKLKAKVRAERGNQRKNSDETTAQTTKVRYQDKPENKESGKVSVKSGPSAATDSESETENAPAPMFAGGYVSQVDPNDKKAKGTADGNGAWAGINYINLYADGSWIGSTTCYTSYYPGSYIGYGSCNWEVMIPAAYQNGVPHTLTAYYSAPNIGSQQMGNSPLQFTLYSGTNAGWNNGNYQTSDDPGVVIGTPPNHGTSGAGSGNFSFSAPVISLGGRGMDVNLSLNYNSLLWHKAGSVITYDIDKGNPAPGWNIGFGKLMDMDTQGGSMIEGMDGSRHPYEGTIQAGSPGYSTYFGRTTDGSFIDYESYRTPTGISGGKAMLANGMQIIYGAAFEGVAYPTYIEDRHGNYITIAYQNNQGPRITTINDNLNRAITFNYDGSNRLVSLTGPAQNGGTRIYVRLHYNTMAVSQSFSGLTPAVRNPNPDIIDAIYYPDLNTGYWFGDIGGSSPSYSEYGMITKVSERLGMSCNCPNPNDQGVISMGNMSREMVYNYPLTAANLSDAPKYSGMTEDWAGRDAGVPTAVTNYSIDNTATPRSTIITLPKGNRIVQYSINSPNQWNDGLLFGIETLSPSPNNQVLSRSVTTWEQGDYNSARVSEMTSTDDYNQTTKQTFTYDQFYNQVATVNEYGYLAGGNYPLYRKKVNTYENSPDYRGTYNGTRWLSGRHIFSLLKTEELFDANTVRLSRNEYNYDQVALTDTPNVVMYDQTNNPNNTQTVQGPNCVNWDQYWVSTGGYWNEWGWWEETGYWESYCTQYEQIPVFDSSTAARGNVTRTTTFSDATPATPQGAISYDSTYDISGNVRTTTTDCCQQMSFYYTTNTQYSQPESHTKGSASDPNLQNVESATYDYNTGLMKTSVNFNGRTTSYGYDVANRPEYTFYPTGVIAQNWYHPGMAYQSQITYFNGAWLSHSDSYFNGRGQATLSSHYAKKTNTYWDPENIIQTNFTYDEMGRKKTVSVPHQANVATAGFTTYQYDNLSRVTQVEAPDGSTSKTFYNESVRPGSASTDAGNTVRSQDAWGRERWARTDDFGRLREVVEPDPNGNGSVLTGGTMLTQYTYTTKDELQQVNQGSQVRMFVYDSLGRLARQKLAEQNGSLNSAGQFVGGDNGGWSDTFQYDNRSNLTQRTDARGVKTNFVYNNDPLNRLQQVNYDKSGAFNDPLNPIYDTAPTNLTYMTTDDKTRVRRAETWIWVEENSYDPEGRISEYKLSGLPSGQEFVTNYLYDSLSRLTEVRYPTAFGMANNPRRRVNPTYDATSRLQELQVDNQIQMSEIKYNPLSQVTELKTGAATANPDMETYQYDAQTGLLTGQQVYKANNSANVLLNLSYDYRRLDGNGNPIAGKTGQLTKITDNLNQNKNRIFEFDTLGRLKTAKAGLLAGGSGVTANWTQQYGYDRYGNRESVGASGVTANNAAVPTDGWASQSYNTASNRINTAGYQYDLAGNLIRGQKPDGSWQRYGYDTTGRLVQVLDDAGNSVEASAYASSRQRLVKNNSGVWTFYAWGGSSVIAEYTSAGWGATLNWAKSYIYAGSRLLSTFTKNGGGEKLEFHHPDRLGTRLITDNNANTLFEQNTLPFGTELAGESSTGTNPTNQRFTSYDRSTVASLDYAVNRSYSSGQGRFTTVDPIGIASSSLGNPQSLNLYAYCQNNPIDFKDPSGLDNLSDFLDGLGSAYAALDSPLCRDFLKANGAFGGRDPKDVLGAYVFQQLLSYGNSREYPTPSPTNPNQTNIDSITFTSGNTGAATLMSTDYPLNFSNGSSPANPILINQSGFFFSLKISDRNNNLVSVQSAAGFSGLSDSDVRGAVIIHELAHAFGVIPGDRTSQNQNNINQASVKANCFSAAAKLSRILNRIRTPTTPITTTPGNLGTSIIGGGGGGGGGGGYAGFGGGDPFRSYEWMRFEQWARGGITYSVSVNYTQTHEDLHAY